MHYTGTAGAILTRQRVQRGTAMLIVSLLKCCHAYHVYAMYAMLIMLIVSELQCCYALSQLLSFMLFFFRLSLFYFIACEADTLPYCLLCHDR